MFQAALQMPLSATALNIPLNGVRIANPDQRLTHILSSGVLITYPFFTKLFNFNFVFTSNTFCLLINLA